ncbi:unnamed protein product [Paramecium primaurelia]|uniref:Uncharacterized protein n=1 Tax=Paramecium primaurelia TaxID=5886 RepID=A0A8S1QS94_PARPR|nr:unnamed protein product [Paramecium primaurelia]
MLALVNTTSSSLRGGGCGSFRMNPRTYGNLESDIQDLDNFITKFNSVVEIICAKADVAINSIEFSKIMIAIQWFIFQEENIYKLNKNPLYREIIQPDCRGNPKIIEKLLDLYQNRLITASLSKAIFSFHAINSDRIMNFDLQKQFLDISDDLKQQIEIEKNDLIQIQMEVYLFLKKLLSRQLQIIITKGRILQKDLQVVYLDRQYNQNLMLNYLNPYLRQPAKFTTYIMGNHQLFKNDLQQNLEEIIFHIEKTHEKLVKNSNNWMNHFLWIQMIGKILVYNPLITKKNQNSQLAHSILKPNQYIYGRNI